MEWIYPAQGGWRGGESGYLNVVEKNTTFVADQMSRRIVSALK